MVARTKRNVKLKCDYIDHRLLQLKNVTWSIFPLPQCLAAGTGTQALNFSDVCRCCSRSVEFSANTGPLDSRDL